MNLHQVLTGAVNPGDHCFSVGSINSVPFTVRKPYVLHKCTHESRKSVHDFCTWTRCKCIWSICAAFICWQGWKFVSDLSTMTYYTQSSSEGQLFVEQIYLFNKQLPFRRCVICHGRKISCQYKVFSMNSPNGKENIMSQKLIIKRVKFFKFIPEASVSIIKLNVILYILLLIFL